MSKSASVSPKLLFWLIAAITIIGGGLTIKALSAGQLSPNESLLLSVILTIFSVGAGWLISHTLYHDSRSNQIREIREEHEKNLEIYAVKASEKVINLSNQIARVVDFLDTNSSAETQTLDELTHRHVAAKHMLGTLKSINDTSLSDWEGVIGERLEDKRKLDQQRDFDINAILEEIRGLSSGLMYTSQQDHYIGDLVQELRRVSSYEAALPPARRVHFKELPCPVCEQPVRLKSNRAGKITKTASTCRYCKTPIAVIAGGSESPRLERRSLKPEAVACSECGEVNAVMLDNVAPSVTRFICSKCGHPAVAHRLHAGGISTKSDVEKPRFSNSQPPLSSEFLDQVEMLLPAQPWPSGIHHEIAEKLSCTPSRVTKATNELIRAGRCKSQVDGVVIEQDKPEAENSGESRNSGDTILNSQPSTSP